MPYASSVTGQPVKKICDGFKLGNTHHSLSYPSSYSSATVLNIIPFHIFQGSNYTGS